MKSERMESLRPEDIAAFVVYLASESAGNINGCIFEVFRGHVGIFVEPPPVAQVLLKDGSWTAEELVKAMPKTLTGDKEHDKFPRTLPFDFNLREE
jgi:hypothetical protein